MTRKTYSVVVVGTACAGTATVFSILDVLASVGRDWEMVHGSGPGRQLFEPRLLTLDGAPYTDPNGRIVTPDGRLDDAGAPDIVIVPDLHIAPTEPLPEAFRDCGAWVRETHASGAIVASVCSGAVMLAQTGLLDGLEVTTHWAYSAWLSRNRPAIRLRAERVLAPAGDGHRIVTAGGASAWADLLLYLIGRLAGDGEARRIARLYLLQPHADGQLHYASLTAGRQHSDALIADAQVWAADHYDDPAPVTAMAARSGLSERNFLRRFRAATGQSPVEYVQTLRVEEAKQMLETTDLPIEEIASEVGYAEPASFRRAFRRYVGLTASAYRRKRLRNPAILMGQASG